MQASDGDDSFRGPQSESAAPTPAEPVAPPVADDIDEVDPWDLSESLRSTTPEASLPPAVAQPVFEPQPSQATPIKQAEPIEPAIADAAVTFEAAPQASPASAPPVVELALEPPTAAPAPPTTAPLDPAYPPRRPLPAHLTHVEPQPERPRIHALPRPAPPPAWPPHGYPPPMPAQPWVILKPRIWPSITTVAVTFGFAVVCSVTALVLAYIVDTQPTFTGGANFSNSFGGWMGDIMGTTWGAALLTLPVQIPLLLGAIIAAVCSPQGFRQRLGLVPSRYPWWTYPLFMVGTPVIAMAVAILGLLVRHTMIRNGSIIETNDMEAIITGPAGIGGLMAVVFLIAVMPAIGEELLFRGLLQRRLLRRWPVVGAIALATGLFLLAHINPIQMFVLIPLGIWLGVLAWQSGSIIPPMLCHLANNAVAIVMARIFSDVPVGTVGETMTVVGLASIPLLVMLGAIVASIAVVVMYAVRHGPPPEASLPLGVMRRVTTYNPPPNAIIFSAPQYLQPTPVYAPPPPAASVPAPSRDDATLWG